MTDDEHPKETLVQIMAPPLQKPLRIFGVNVEPDGEMTGWSEPVLYVGLMERRWRDGTIATELVPIIYDPNAAWGFSPLTDIHDCPHDPGDLIPEDAAWDEVIEKAVSIRQSAEWRSREKKAARA